MADAQIDARELRNVLGAFVTGVTIITTCDAEGRPYGLTANSFSSVSLEPPLVLWSQSLVSPSYPVFRDAPRFAISILAEDQAALSVQFAKSSTDKFTGVRTIPGIGGIPLIHGAAAHLECRKVTSYPGGDHAVFLGHVERMERSRARPLVFGGGRYLLAYPHDLGTFSADIGLAKATHLHAVRLGTAAVVRLAADLKTTACLGVWGTGGTTIVRWEESVRPVSANLRTGVVLPMLRSAAGQIFAAYLPRELTGEMLEAELREMAGPAALPEFYASEAEAESALDFGAYLPPDLASRMVPVNLARAADQNRQRLVMSRSDAEQRLAEVRQRGLARNIDLEPDPDQPAEERVVAVSAPVFDSEGVLAAAITALAYASEFTGDWDSPLAAAVRATAREVSTRLGYDG